MTSIIGGFDRQFEGFQVQGNLSVHPHGDITYGGNGSIEASGALYVDCIKSYSTNGNICILENIFFSDNQLVSLSSSPSFSISDGSFLLSGGLSINNSTDAVSITSGGTITTAGGVAIGKQLFVGQDGVFESNIFVDNTVYSDYIDANSSNSVTIQNNFIVTNDTITSLSQSPSINSSTGSFISEGGISINNTTNATDLTSGGALTIAGGTSIAKDLYVGGQTFLYDNLSIYNSLVTLNDTSSLLIQNTVDASEFSGGALTVLGGMSIGQSFYVNGSTFLKDGLDTNKKRITNVALPVDGWDAVNKNYLLAQLQSFTPGGGDGEGECCNVNPTGPTVQITYQLNENVLIPEDIPTFTFDSSIYRSFVSYVYLDAVSGSKHTLFMIKGVYKQSGWVVNTSFIGDPSGIDFYVRTSETHAIIQYTNKNTFGPSYILFNTPYFVRVDTTENVERTITLNESVSQPEATNILYIGGSIVATQGLAYVSVDNKYAFFIINTVLSEGQWKYHTTFIGDDTNVRFYLDTTGEVGTLMYTNNNSSPANVIWKETKITASTQQYELQLNTSIPVALSQLQLGNLNERTKHYTISVEVPNENKAAFYFIDAILDGNLWKINTRFMGSPIGVDFSCQTVNGIGTIYYTNTNTTQTILRYIVTTPQAYTPPGVGSGGTGVTSLLENAVLRGNGTQGILATTDFIYEDYTVKLSALSSIEIYNDTEPINSTTGMTITTLGGASIGKDLYVDHVNITPSSGDLVKESEYSAQNNLSTPEIIDGFRFDSNKVRAFHALVSVEVICDGLELYSCHDIHGINKESQWVINNRFIGDNTGISFSIDYDNQYGQLKYTSQNHQNWQQSKIKFRALTTTK